MVSNGAGEWFYSVHREMADETYKMENKSPNSVEPEKKSKKNTTHPFAANL